MKITARQGACIAFLSICANKFLLLPSLMFEEAKANAIFSLIFLFFADFLTLFLFFYIKNRFPNQNLKEILDKLVSPFGEKIMYFVFMLFFFLKALLTFAIVYVYLRGQVYLDEFFWIAIISIFPVVSHAVIKGLRPLSRTIELFLGIIVTGFVVCLFFSLFTEMKMPSFFTTNFESICRCTYKNIFSFGDFLVLFVIIDKIQFEKTDKKVFINYTLFAFFLIFLLFMLFYSKYEVTSFMHNNALSDIVVFSVKFSAVGRMDIIAMLTIMFFTLFEIEIFTYAFCECFVSFFPKLSKTFAVIFFDILFLIIYYIFIGKYETIVTSFSEILPYLALLPNYVFPLLIWLRLCFFSEKGVKNEENT